MATGSRVLGVILAGGANRRFGSHKALARIAGRTILERTLDALAPVVEQTVIVANEPEPYLAFGLAIRPDIRPDRGVLGGILTAVHWAGEQGREAALVLGCDMPFVPSSLLARIAEEADPEGVTLPASEGRRGFEPLCAAYGTGTLDAIERALALGERAVISFFPTVPVRILDFEIVSRFGDPARMFLNVNRPEDRQRAESLASGATGTTGRKGQP
jgi:molybdopterin-guanine dinucleotide biosynthesis protein A